MTDLSIEYFTLHQYTKELITAFSQDTLSVATALVDADLLSQEQLEEVQTEKGKDEILKAKSLVLLATETVQISPEKFKDLLDALSQCHWLQELVESIQTQYQSEKAKVGMTHQIYHHKNKKSIILEG